MRIVIVGGGVVGFALAEHLLKDHHQLSMVEQDNAICQQIGEKLDLLIVNGSGSSPSILREAGLTDADMVLAVTPVNDVNIIVCTIANQYGVPSRIARLRGSEYLEKQNIVDLEKLGITSVIHPERILADHILQYVETPHALESANFEDGRILLRGYRVSEKMPIAGKTPRQIREEIAPSIVLFSAVVRNHKGMIPDGDTLIQAGDIVYSLFPRESLKPFLNLMGIESSNNRKIIITGDSYATEELAASLSRTDHHITFVDPDIDHANKVAATLDHLEVLHGDCTQHELLRELNVNAASFFIAVSDAADYNMLSALLAKAEGAHEVIVTSSEPRHTSLFRSIGIDHVIVPRLTTARHILDMVSRGHIGAVVPLSDVDIEAVRFIVEPDSDIAGMKVRNIATKLKKGSIIGIIVREHRLIIPEGETVVEANDHIIVITHHHNLGTIAKLFKPRGWFRH